MNLGSRYKFFIDFTFGGLQEVFPVNNQLAWAWTLNEKYGFYRYELTTELCFKNHNGNNTFDLLYEMEKLCNVCFEIPLIIEKRCTPDDDFEEYWTGYIPFRSGTWDFDQCMAEIKPRVTDEYSCILDNEKKEINLLTKPDRVEIDTIIGDIEYKECCTELRAENDYFSDEDGDLFDFIVSDCVDLTEGWTWVTHSGSWTTDNIPNDPTEGTWEICTTWAREFVAGPNQPPGFGWISVVGGWARPVPKNNLNTTNIISTFYSSFEIIDFESDNGLTLEQILNCFFQDCDDPVCSNFFGINPDGTNPNNIAYQCAQEDLWNLVFFQGSDILIADADENATKFNKSWCEFWENLNNVFFGNLRWWFDPVSQCHRIEHVSYQVQANSQLNLTLDKFKKCMDGKNRYEYDDLDFPLKEIWRTKDEDKTSFSYTSIDYNITCSNDDSLTNEKEYPADCTLLNLSKYYNEYSTNDDNEIDENLLDSMFIIATDADGFVKSNAFGLNGVLALEYMLPKYGYWNRPLNSGLVDGEAKVFFSSMPQRKQREISIEICCDKWDLIQPTFRVKTDFGIGNFGNSIQYIEMSEIATFDICFRC